MTAQRLPRVLDFAFDLPDTQLILHFPHQKGRTPMLEKVVISSIFLFSGFLSLTLGAREPALKNLCLQCSTGSEQWRTDFFGRDR